MNVFEKIREELEKYHEHCINAYGVVGGNKQSFATKQCIEIVNQVEQENNNGWIPCSERLPEKYAEYLCVNKYGSYILGYPYRNKADDDLIMVETENEIMLEVIAWQPLPQPYKESDANGN